MSNKRLLIFSVAFLLIVGAAIGGYFYGVDSKNKPSENSNPVTDGIEETNNITWSRDDFVSIEDGSVPYVRAVTNYESYTLYYCKKEGIFSASSSEGIVFHERGDPILVSAGGQESVVCDPTVATTSANFDRLYYTGSDRAEGGPGVAKHKILSAVSADGVHFSREGIRIDSDKTDDNGWASVPEAIVLSDGRVRIYYVTSTNQIVSAISDEGLVFKKEDGYRIDTPNFVDPAILQLENGTYLLIVAVPERPQGSSNELPEPGLYSFTSDDGLIFSNRQTVLVENGVLDPTVTYLGIGENKKKLRIYFGKTGNDGETSIQSVTGTIE
jgi:hypothetical protein